MDVIRVSVVVIVAYVLGLGTGLVGGVVYSFKNFSSPVPAQATALEGRSPSPGTSVAPMAGASPEAHPSTASSGVAVTASPSASTVAMTEPSPSVDASATPATSPSETPSASPAKASPEPEPSETPTVVESPTPEVSPSKTPPPPQEDSTLVVMANKGKGFKIFINGNDTNETTPATIQVPPGTNTIKVVGGDKFRSWTAKVTTKAGQKKTVQAALAAIPPPPPVVTAPQPVYYPPARPAPQPVYRPRPSGSSSGGSTLPGNRRF